MTKANLNLRGGVIQQKDFSARMREQLDRAESIRTLRALQAQLRTPNGSVKGGILRLMNASDHRGNPDKTMVFERKNWMQGARYFSSASRQRTAEALKILFQNAGLSTRKLEQYLQENSNKAGGESFLALLNEAVTTIETVKNSDFDIDKTASAARGLTATIDQSFQRADIDDLVHEFNTLNDRYEKYVDELELPPEEGRERTITQTPPVLAAKAQIEAARTKLSQLQEAAAVSGTETERVQGLIGEALARVDLCRARYDARERAGTIHRELTTLRSEIEGEVTRGLSTAKMSEDQARLKGLRTTLLWEISRLTTQIESDYLEYRRDPEADWHRYSGETRAAVRGRLTELAQQFDVLRAERRSVLLGMAEPGRAELDLAADRAQLEALKTKRQSIVDAARTERDKLTSLCKQWRPSKRWADMTEMLRRPSNAEQRTLDFKARAIMARENGYLRGASWHFGLPAGDPSDGASLSRFAQLIADPLRREEAIDYARANRVRLGGAEAIGVLAARGLAADPARVAAFALAVVDVEADNRDKQLRVLLMGAFPPPAGSAFGTFSAEFHSAVRALAEVDAATGLAVAEDAAMVYGGLVAPPRWTGSPGPIERAVLTIRQQEEVRLEGLDARDAIVSLGGASYDLRGTRFQNSTVFFELHPGFSPHGQQFRNITLDRWPGTTVAFTFRGGQELRPTHWDATLEAAGRWVTSLPLDRGEQVAALIRQLTDFSDEIHNQQAVFATVAVATLRYPEVARDPQVRAWIESQGGWDEMIDRSWDEAARERVEHAVSIKRLTDGSMSDGELMVILFRVPQLLSDPPVFQAVLARESRDEMFAKLFLLLPQSKRSFCLGLMAAPATASQTEDLRRRLSWAERSPIPAPGSADPEPTVAQVEAHVAVLEDVAARAPFLFGQALHAEALPNLFCWRDRMNDNDPATLALRARIDAIEQAALHAPRFDPQVSLYARADLLPAIEQMGYGRTVDGKWVWDSGQHYLIPTRTLSGDGQVFLLVRADAYRAMGQRPGAVDWGQVHVLTAARPPGAGPHEASPVVRQLGGAARASRMQAAAEDLLLMQAALLSGEAEFPGKLFKHLGVSPAVQGLLGRGIKGIGIDGGSKEGLRQETDERMAVEVVNWVTQDGQLTTEHLTALRAWATEQRVVTDDREFAMFMFNLSASVTRLGSESGLGTAGSSVGALRQYGHLLFRQCRGEIQKVLEARPELIQGKEPWGYLNKIDSVFQADTCSDQLSVPMMDLGANMHLASYLRTAPQRWMNPNRAELLQEILAGNEGGRRAADQQQAMSLEVTQAFPVDNDAIQAQEDNNPAEWPSLSRIFNLFRDAMTRAHQETPDYPGFVIGARRGLSSYQAYVNAAGYAPTSQFSHLPANQRDAAAQAQGLILGVGDWAQTQTVFRGDGSVAGTRHTPHSALVEQANEMQGRLELADGHVVNEALLSWVDAGEAWQAYVNAGRALKLANEMVPDLQNWEGPLPARLDDYREQRMALLTARAAAPMQTVREALPRVIEALRHLEAARAEIARRDQLITGAIERRESEHSRLPEGAPRREVLSHEIEALQAHRGVLAASLGKLSGEALIAFETELRRDLDFLGRLGLLPDPPGPDPVDDVAVAIA